MLHVGSQYAVAVRNEAHISLVIVVAAVDGFVFVRYALYCCGVSLVCLGDEDEEADEYEESWIVGLRNGVLL